MKYSKRAPKISNKISNIFFGSSRATLFHISHAKYRDSSRHQATAVSVHVECTTRPINCKYFDIIIILTQIYCGWIFKYFAFSFLFAANIDIIETLKFIVCSIKKSRGVSEQ